MSRITAIFDNRVQAEQAINELRRLGVSDNDISIVARHDDVVQEAEAHADDAAASADGASKGLLAGAGAGALFGLAAALIPGVGPFITAGTLLTSVLGAAGGGMAAGAIVGGTTGAIAGALAKSGYDEHEAGYYGSAVESGGVLVAVHTNTLSDAQVNSSLSQFGGRTSGTTTGIMTTPGNMVSGSTVPPAGSSYGAGGHNVVTGGPATTDAGKTGLGTGAVVCGLVGTVVGGPVGAVVGGAAGSLLGGVAGDATEAASNPASGTTGTMGTGADVTPGNSVPGIQTGGHTTAGADTRGITEKAADAITGDRTDDKTGGRTM